MNVFAGLHDCVCRLTMLNCVHRLNLLNYSRWLNLLNYSRRLIVWQVTNETSSPSRVISLAGSHHGVYPRQYETSVKYFAYKMEENSSASEHVLRMSGYYNYSNQVRVNLPDKIVIDRVL